MSEITHLLQAAESGDAAALERVLPLVYAELRQLAQAQLARERPGQTLDATALVHEAYLRLVGPGVQFANRRHFFAAAGEAMRRILVDAARRKQAAKHGGDRVRVGLDPDLASAADADSQLLDVHAALDDLHAHDAVAADLVRMHFFAGLTLDQSAEALGLSPRTAYRKWSYARAWLYRRLGGHPSD